jgi:cytochrome c biogenesis protein CcmG, thiol:disulfide interchange protein DsbE
MSSGRILPPLAALTLMLAACTDTSAEPAPCQPSSPALRAVTDAASLPTEVACLPTMSVEGFHELLGELRGTPVVVNLWASWCEPCEREAPMLTAAAKQHREVQFVGVDVQDGRGGAERFVEDHGIPYPSVFDPDAEIRTDLGSFGLPVTVFYDAAGDQSAKVDGELSAQALDTNLRAIAR